MSSSVYGSLDKLYKHVIKVLTNNKFKINII